MNRTSIEQIRQLQDRRGRRSPQWGISSLVAGAEDSAARTHKRLGKLIDLWQELVPPDLARRTTITSVRGGVVHVSVESSAIHWELDRLLREGLEQELRSRYSSTLSRVRITLAGPPEK